MKPSFLLLAFTLWGCDVARQEVGGFTCVFQTVSDAEQAHARGLVVLQIREGKVAIQPRRVPTLSESKRTQVVYTVKLDLTKDWDVRDDDAFRALVRTELEPEPVDIYDIKLAAVRYVNRNLDREHDIASFYSRVSERGIGGWSKQEIELLLPIGYELPALPVDARRHKVWLDWPSDERQLSLDFEYDVDKREQILKGCGLDYPK
jgi:hypothetical protein